MNDNSRYVKEDAPVESVTPEVLWNEDGVMWVTFEIDPASAAAAMTAACDEGWLDEPIYAEDLKHVGMRPMTPSEVEAHGEAGDIECALDDPNKVSEWWRWAE